jgi:hypothetical protein
MNVDEDKLKVCRFKCRQSLLFQTRWLYKQRQGRKFIVAEPHRLIAEALEKVFRGELTRLIINIAPRYGKTELAVKNAIAHGLALNPAAKFIHLTYSAKLALDNSEEAKDIVTSEPFQQLFDVQIKKDSKAKDKWYTTAGGGVYAAATGGQVTGFGAGKIDEETELDEGTLEEFFQGMNDFIAKGEFGGAIIIDDPIKPEDGCSEVKRNRVNDRFETTIRNRANSRKTPIIVIQQRVHANDLSGYLMEIEPGEWTVLRLPCLKSDGTALWELKHTVDELLKLKRINEYIFEAQYQQNPQKIKKGGEWLSNFSYNRHAKKLKYDKDYPVHISIDSNVYPYIAMTAWQIIPEGQKTKIRLIHELPAADPDNTATRAGKKLVNWLVSIGYTGKVFLYGDKSTKNRNNIDDNKRTFFMIIVEALLTAGFKVEDKVLAAPPPVHSIGDFVNALLSGEIESHEIEVNAICLTAITDFQNVKKDENGNMLKVRIKHPTIEDVTYEKDGHFTDTFKDFIIQAFYPLYQQLVNKHKKLIPGGISQVNRQSNITL